VAPQFSGMVKTATPLVAICIIVTSIVVPILTGLWYRQFGKGKAEQVAHGPAGEVLHPAVPEV